MAKARNFGVRFSGGTTQRVIPPLGAIPVTRFPWKHGRRPYRSKLTIEQRRAIPDLYYGQNMTITAIAQMYKVSHWCISEYMKQAHLEKRPRW